MRIPEADENAADDLLASHAAFMEETHSLTKIKGKLHTLEYHVSKAPKLIDVMDPTQGTTGSIIYCVNEVHKDDDHFSKHVALGKAGVE